MKISKKYIVIPLVLAIAIGMILVIPRRMVEGRLRALGYSKDAIREIENRKLTQQILDNGWYSPYLDQSLANGTVLQDYLILYTIRDAANPLTAEEFNLYARLKDFGYEDRQIVQMFQNLSYFEITPLLVFDYQYDLTYYIRDCQQNREGNNPTSFTLTNSYYTPYQIVTDANTEREYGILVNQTNGLDASYAPEDLEELPISYAVGGLSLRSDAAKALRSFCNSAADAGAPIYAISAYRSYETQEALYNKTKGNHTDEYADRYAIRPGYSEHQTGLAVNLASTEKDVDYEDSVGARWAASHCYEYGWIERYPPSKASITQVDDEPDHYRYVGREMALAVKQSQLTFDEFYAVYLAPWEDETLKPSQVVLGKLIWYDMPKQKPEETPAPEETAAPEESPQPEQTPQP